MKLRAATLLPAQLPLSVCAIDTCGGALSNNSCENLQGKARFFPLQHVYVIFAWAALMMKFWKNLTGPCPAPTYLPTYLPYLWETKKEITFGVKVGYYTN